MYSVGSIIIIRNLVFKNDNHFDHAYKCGRPCLVISVLDDDLYFLPLTSSEEQKKYDDTIEIKNDYCFKANTVVKVNCIYCRQGYFHEEKCKIEDTELIKILSYFYKYQLKYLCDDLFLRIKDDIQNTINTLSKSINYEKKLVYKYK